MRALVLAAALLLSACAQEAAAPPQAAQSAPPELTPVTLPQADGAGNRLEALTRSGARWCSADNAWCIEQISDAPARVTAGDQAISVPSPGSPWPYVIRVGADNAIVGLVDADEQTYSGGGARVDRVTLFQVSNGAATRLATLPIASSISIRACFGPENERQRAGACADEYRFVSRIRLDEAVMSGPPHIVLETAAASFPGRVTRTADSLAQPQLSEADHVWATDDMCSFRRTYAPISNGGYAPDTELPACTDYLEP